MPSSRPTFPLHGWNSRSINVTNRSLYHFEGTTLAERCKVDNNTMAQGPLRLTTSVCLHACKPLVEFELQRQLPDCVPSSAVDTGWEGGGGRRLLQIKCPRRANHPYRAFLLNYRTVNYSTRAAAISTLFATRPKCALTLSTAWIINLNVCDSIGPLLVTRCLLSLQSMAKSFEIFAS